MDKEFAAEVLRDGRTIQWTDAEGQALNVRHNISFETSAVKTDGNGNIEDMPLLRRKPCFAQPHIFYHRGFWRDAAFTIEQKGKTVEVRKESRCYRCPIRAVCAQVCRERVLSDITIKEAFERWYKARIGIAGMMPIAARENSPEWEEVLSAIVAHGPWKNINDAAVLLDRREREKARIAKRNTTKRDKRAAKRGARRAITQPFLDAVNAERDRRLADIMRLRRMNEVPQVLRRLNTDGCEFLADVWRAMTLVKRAGEAPTGAAIAEAMTGRGLPADMGKPTASILTKVLRYRDRLDELEITPGGEGLWQPFAFDEPLDAVAMDDVDLAALGTRSMSEAHLTC